jgi:hypothetical protein
MEKRMSDLLKNGMSWLESQREKYVSTLVAYRRGSASAEVPATIGKTIFRIEDEYGRVVCYESRDFLISTEKLVLNGTVVLPERGDEIIDGGFIYEVMAPANEPEWRYSDAFRNTLRIHTKNTGKE